MRAQIAGRLRPDAGGLTFDGALPGENAIADALGISVRTVGNYLTHLYEVTGCDSEEYYKDEDYYDDGVDEAQEWFDYDPEC